MKKHDLKFSDLHSSCAGVTLIEAIVSIAILSITAMTMASNVANLMFSARLTDAQLNLEKVQKLVRPELTRYMQEWQRNLSEHNCKNDQYDVITLSGYGLSEMQTWGDILPSDLENPDLKAVIDRCISRRLQNGSLYQDYSDSAVFYRCFEFDPGQVNVFGGRTVSSTRILVEAKGLFWGFNANQSIKCKDLGGLLGRGIQIFYKIYSLNKIREKPIFYNVSSLSGHIVAPKAVFTGNETRDEITDDENR